MKLKNKIALITGAGSAIGRSIAIAFSKEGANVVLVARTREQLENVAKEIKQKGQKALPMIQQTGAGRIINIASTAGKTPVTFNTAYSASKHGLLGLTKSLASDDARAITREAFNICGGRIFH